jgi:23S rRNA (cytidine1920-2'-O)/16S rRNA (cytidine1409-2'-O)-methyltransferase
VDVSFISLAKVLPALVACMVDDGEVLALVKPQFEVGPKRVGKGGVVRDPAARRDALLGVARAAAGIGLAVRGFAPSGLPGPKGNLETFIWCARQGEGLADLEGAVAEVEA